RGARCDAGVLPGALDGGPRGDRGGVGSSQPGPGGQDAGDWREGEGRMNLSTTVLGSHVVKQLQAKHGEAVLQVGTDRLTRRDLAKVHCYNFQAARKDRKSTSLK